MNILWTIQCDSHYEIFTETIFTEEYTMKYSQDSYCHIFTMTGFADEYSNIHCDGQSLWNIHCDNGGGQIHVNH